MNRQGVGLNPGLTPGHLMPEDKGTNNNSSSKGLVSRHAWEEVHVRNKEANIDMLHSSSHPTQPFVI